MLLHNIVRSRLKTLYKMMFIALFLSIGACVHAQASDTAHLFIRNAGVGGNNTIDMLKRVRKDCLNFRPDLTILMAGTNDMNSVKYVPLEQYKQNLTRLLDSIKSSGSKVLLMNILPFYEPYLLTRHPSAFYGKEGPAGRQAAVNSAIAKIAKNAGVPLIDIHHYFEKVGRIGLDKYSLIRNEANSGLTDGIHPTVDGYRLIASLVYQRIIAEGLPHTRIVCFGDSITKGDGSIDKNSYPAFLKSLLQQ